MSKIRILTMIAVLCWTVPAWAADAFYSISLARLELSEGQPPSRSLRSQASPAAYLQAMQPYAVLDGPGEVYLTRM
jgi:hypothetical protein